MDKESIYLLQKLDCNCNDCKFMVRDNNRYNQSVELHHRWQLDYFNTIKEKLLEKAKFWERKQDYNRSQAVLKQAESMKFQFDKTGISISYGHCSKLDKPVSFMPNTLQLDTQNCFVHRKDLI